MSFHQIVEIKINAKKETSSEEFKVQKWYNDGNEFIKDDELSKCRLRKIDEQTFIFTIEQLDLFGIDLGIWTEKDHPERENMIKELIDKIKQGLKCEITITEIKREVK